MILVITAAAGGVANQDPIEAVLFARARQLSSSASRQMDKKDTAKRLLKTLSDETQNRLSAHAQLQREYSTKRWLPGQFFSKLIQGVRQSFTPDTSINLCDHDPKYQGAKRYSPETLEALDVLKEAGLVSTFVPTGMEGIGSTFVVVSDDGLTYASTIQ